MSDAQLLQRLDGDFAPRVDAIEKDNEAQKPEMQAVINKLSDALRAVDQPLILRYAKTLEGQVEIYAGLVTRVRRLVAELGAIDTKDADALKRIEGLTKRASAAEDKILRNYEQLKKLLDMAHQKGKDPAIAKALTEWAGMESWMTTQRDVLRIRVKQMQTLLELAKSSAADGDAKSFAQAQEKAKVRLTWKPTQREVGDHYMNFCNNCKAALGKDLQAELQRDFEKFKRMVSELADLNDQLDALLATIQKMKMPAVAPKLDVHKAAGLLNVAEAKLKKAWDGAAPGAAEKALDGLARELKLKTTGKEMVATLRKAKLLA
jgi:hypothetical protein